MQTIKLDPKDIEQIFHPTKRITLPSDALHRLIYSARVERYFTLSKTAGKFWLMGATAKTVDWHTRKPKLGGWFETQEFEDWQDVLAWAVEFKAVIALPEPTNQVQVIEDIYRLVFGADWDRAIKIDGWPTCNKDTWMAIAKRFIEFDHQHHPDVVAGGRWMNNGFSGHDESLKNWEVTVCGIITADTPIRYTLRCLVMEDGSVSSRTRVVKEYQGCNDRDYLDSQDSWDEAAKLCASPEPLTWERSSDGDYVTWHSQWVGLNQEVCCAA